MNKQPHNKTQIVVRGVNTSNVKKQFKGINLKQKNVYNLDHNLVV